MRFTIRPLTSDDATAFHAIRRTSLEIAPQAFGSSPEDDRFATIEATRATLGASSNATVFGAFTGDHLIGIVGVTRPTRRKTKHVASLQSMFVEPEHRGSGAASALVGAACEHARTIGCEQMILSVSETALAARKLYARHHFEEWGRQPRAIFDGGEYIDVLKMWRDLTA